MLVSNDKFSAFEFRTRKKKSVKIADIVHREFKNE